MKTTATVTRAKRGLVKRIREVRGERSQRAFARDLGVSQQNISHYELGYNTPHTDFLVTLALKEKISIDWLLLGRGHRTRRAR